MGDVQKVAKNSFFITLGNMLHRLLGVVIVSLLARAFGQEGYGVYTIVVSYLAIASLISNFGTTTILTRDYSKYSEKNDFFNKIFSLRFLLSIATLIVLFVFLSFSNYSFDIILYSMIACSSILLQSYLGSTYSIYQIKLRMDVSTAIELFNKFLLTILIFAIGLFKLDLIYVFFALVMCYALSSFIAFLHSKIVPAFNFKGLKNIFKESLPIGAAETLNIFISRIFVIILSFAKNLKEVGLFGCTYIPTEVFYLIPTALMGPLFPILCNYHQSKNYEMLRKSFKLAQRYMFMLSFPIGIGLSIFAKQAIGIVYGDEFQAASPLLTLWSLSLIFGFSGTVIWSVLYSIGKQNKNLKIISINFVYNFIVAMILIPPFGALGATVAFLSGTLIYWAMMWYEAVKNELIKMGDFVGLSLKPFIASIIMLAVSVSLMENWIIAILAGGIAYCISIIFIGGVEKEDWELLQKVIKR